MFFLTLLYFLFFAKDIKFTSGRSLQSHSRGNSCPPVQFNVKSGRKYLVFVRNLRSPGRYIATAKPEVVRRKSLREAKQILNCKNCGEYMKSLTLVGQWGRGGWFSLHFFQTSISPWKTGAGGFRFLDFS